MSTNSTASALGTATLRILAGIVGGGIIAGVTWAAITAIGGISAPTAPLLIAHAVGLVVGAMCIGIAVKSRRFVVASGLILMLVAGEAYTLLNTSERELDARETKQIPARAATERRAQLAASIAKGEAALATMTTSYRLEKALEVQARVSKSAMDTAAGQFCGRHCTADLEKGRVSAQKEVDAARAALEADRAGLKSSVDADRAALAAIPAVAALSPLAARLAVADWKLDLLRAGLLTLSANGLGAFLLVFAAHSGRRESVSVSDSVPAETPKALSFERPLSDEEIEQIRRILTGRSDPVTNDELAALAGVSKSEMSKRVQKAVDAGKVVKFRNGRFNAISLVA